MKRAFSYFMSLLLAICLIIPAALAETGDDALMAQVNAQFLFSRSGAIHALTYDGVMYQRTGEGWMPVGHVYEDIWAADAVGEDIWLISRKEDKNGAWFELCRAAFDEQGMLTGTEGAVEVEWDVDVENWPQLYGFVVEDGAAFILTNKQDWSAQSLYRIDMTSGKGTKICEGPLDKIIRYKDGLLLAKRFEWGVTENDMPEVVTVDPSSGSMTVIGLMNDYNSTGLIYDSETDAAYFSDSSYVYRVDGDAPQTVGYLALNGGGDRVIMHEGRYCIADYNGWVSATIDPALLPKHVLRIQQSWQVESEVLAFARLHPDIAIEYVNGYWSDLEDFTRFAQGDNAPDILTTDLGPDFITLRDRKYLIDLASSEVLAEVVNRMAPNVTKDILVDGKLYALPYSLNVSMNGYYAGGLEKAGLTAEVVPSSYEGLLNFIERWHDEYFEENEGMRLFEYYTDLREWLFYEMYTAQLRACQADGVLTLDTPVFRKLLARLEEITPVIEEVAPPQDGDEFENDAWDNALFTDMIDDLIREYPFNPTYSAHPMPLALDEQSDPVINAYLSLMIVNPYSENADAAVAFLEYLAQNLPVTQRVALMPEENDPIERYHYEEELQEMKDRAVLMEQLLADAPEENRADIEDELDYVRYHIKECEENRWAMTAEEILWYRENIAPYLIFTTVDVYSSNTAEQLANLRRRYLDGQANADEFIKRFEEIVWMKQQEQH